MKFDDHRDENTTFIQCEPKKTVNKRTNTIDTNLSTAAAELHTLTISST